MAIFVIYINTISGKPDVLIDPKNQLVGVAINDTLYLNNTRRSKFVARIWKQDLALENVSPWEELSRDYLKCDAEACRLTLQETKLSFIKNGTAFSEECNQGGLLIAARQKIPRWCHQNSQDDGNRALDYWGLRKGGVHSISLKQGALPNIQTVSEFTGNRPWNRGD